MNLTIEIEQERDGERLFSLRMSRWPSTKAKRVLATLEKIGWRVKRHRRGSHRVLAREGWDDFVFAFHAREEIGPA